MSMSMHEMIAEGQRRRNAYEQEQQEITRKVQEQQAADLEMEWRPILDDLTDFYLPAGWPNIPVPDYSPSKRISLTIDLPTAGKIFCYNNLNVYRNEHLDFVFQALSPSVGHDTNEYGVSWKKTGFETPDFLVALAEATELAERLPAAQAEAAAKNAAWSAPVQVEPDWLDDAMQTLKNNDFRNSPVDHALRIQWAQTSALIAIAQELSRLNRLT